MAKHIDEIFAEVFAPEHEANVAARIVVECQDQNGTFYEVQDGFGNQIHVADTEAQAARLIEYDGGQRTYRP